MTKGIMMAGIMAATGVLDAFDVRLPEPKQFREPTDADFERLKKAQEKRDRKAAKNLINKK